MAELHQYAPDYCDISFGSVPFQGFAEKFIEIEYEEDDFKDQTGALGDVTRTRQLNRTAKVTVTLMDASPTNDQIMSLAATDRRTGRGAQKFFFRDRSSNTEVRAAQAWVMKIPKIERGKESGTVQWVFRLAFAKITVGGSVL